MFDIRLFRRRRLSSALKEEGRLVVEDLAREERSVKYGVLFLFVLGLVFLAASLLYGIPFTPQGAFLILGVVLLAVVYKWILRRWDQKIWAEIQQLPDREKIDAAIAELKKPESIWIEVVWAFFMMLWLMTGQNLILEPSSLLGMAWWLMGLKVLFVFGSSGLIGWLIWKSRRKKQKSDIEALERWREEIG